MSKETVLAELQALVGKTTAPGEWLLVDQSLVNRFGEITGETDFAHTDPERARRELGVPNTIAQGNLSLAMTPRLTDPVSPYRKYRKQARYSLNLGWNRVRYPGKLLVGSRVRATAKLLEVGELPENRLQLVTEFTVEVEGQDKPCCVAQSVGRFYF